ncbi:MAG: leucyl/phenylalanyl-tRNA--protein transferase [Gammaproteobacteria bacterium]|nr:leucyl/phenylalanyl-tRNA--protein transferase [Gammaproteobacteria bacterium]
MTRSVLNLRWIPADAPPDDFPPPELAMTEPDGLLAAGGDLSPARLLAAYQRGIFPWFSEGQPILWWSPDPRAVILPAELRVSRSLRKKLRQRPFAFTVDSAFPAVIQACAEAPRPGQDGTWITPDMQAAYIELHRQGHAHSIEVWQEDSLVGGLYGLAIGKTFCGESMFSQATDASKAAFLLLVRELQARDFTLIDCQLDNPHLASLGCQLLPRAQFLARLHAGQAGHAGAENAEKWTLSVSTSDLGDYDPSVAVS